MDLAKWLQTATSTNFSNPKMKFIQENCLKKYKSNFFEEFELFTH